MANMHSINQNKNSSTGFTLIEILVALAIIAIALGALIKASGDHTNTAGFLKQKTLAHWVAMNELTLLQTGKQWPDLGTEKKSTEMANHQWFWTRETRELPDPVTGEPSQQARQIIFTVFADENREHNLTKLIGFLEKP
ncbi:MAG: type II secretion system minor pseudopilin GspI [Gammaproteobacteria bacterium]|nr:type II secretion system minor pseudopilin GspI [Gammaproteobacteria bacterium]